MATQNKPYVIVVAIDFSEKAHHALTSAKALALREKNAELHVVHVVAPPVGTVAVVGATDMASAFTETLDRTRQELKTACNEVSQGLVDRVYGHVRTGRPAREIAELSAQLGADLIVVGTHGRTGVSRALLGSVAEEVVRHAPCDVLTVRRTEVPAIEPACAECVQAQRASGNANERCARHHRRHAKPHTYSDGQDGLWHQTFRFE